MSLKIKISILILVVGIILIGIILIGSWWIWSNKIPLIKNLTFKTIDEIKASSFSPRSISVKMTEKSLEFPMGLAIPNIFLKTNGEEFKEMGERLLYVIENAEYVSPYCCCPGCFCEPPKFTSEIKLKNGNKISLSSGGIDWCINGKGYILKEVSEENNPIAYLTEDLYKKLSKGIEALKGNAILTTDKIEYQRGEKVVVILKYEGVIYQWGEYPWSIQKWENSSWANIQTKVDRRLQRIPEGLYRNFLYRSFCMPIPECKDISFEVIKQCPLITNCEVEWWRMVKDEAKFIWDQTYKSEEKTFKCERGKTGEIIRNLICSTFTQVPPGRYKIRFKYSASINLDNLSSREVNIKYAEKEISIK